MNGTDKCHGVSQEKAESEGIDTKDVLTQYKHDIDNRCMMLVSHNVNVDVRVVASEFVRTEMEIQIVKTNCTMQEGVNYCHITPKVYLFNKSHIKLSLTFTRISLYKTYCIMEIRLLTKSDILFCGLGFIF